MKSKPTLYAKPSPLLETHLKNIGINWASVLSVAQWHDLWNNNEIPSELQLDFQAFDDWLAQGAHASMHFLENNRDVRKDPRKILAGVESILTVIVPYSHGKSVRKQRIQSQSEKRDEASAHSFSSVKSSQANSTAQSDFIEKIARYARVADYHKAIKTELNKVMEQWQHDALSRGLISAPVHWRVATDSLPFLDRAHARLAGLGFVGKNTMLIRPGVGSYFFIAQVLLEAPFHLLADEVLSPPTAAHAMAELDCGTCTRCIDACPTSALTQARFLDSNRCLSFLTIEHKDTIADEFIPHLGEHFYGCDVCQEVCSYNLKTLPLQSIQQFDRYHLHFESLTMNDVARMNPSEYEKWFGGTAMTRAKYGGLVRNALYSMFASNDSALDKVLADRRDDPLPLIAATVAQINEINKRRSARDPQ